MWEMIAILAHTVFVIFKGAMKNLRVSPLMQPNLN